MSDWIILEIGIEKGINICTANRLKEVIFGLCFISDISMFKYGNVALNIEILKRLDFNFIGNP